MESGLTIFLCGVGGSAAIEILTIYQIYKSGAPFPKRYKLPGFWCVRALLAAAAGGLALAYEVDKVILAVNIGVATPLILSKMAETAPDSIE